LPWNHCARFALVHDGNAGATIVLWIEPGSGWLAVFAGLGCMARLPSAALASIAGCSEGVASGSPPGQGVWVRIRGQFALAGPIRSGRFPRSFFVSGGEQMGSTRYALCGLAAAMLIATAGASAQNYPTKPIRIIVPFGAGGPADIYARYLAQQMQQPLGQSFIVENRPGAGSIIGTDLVAKSAPDGYTLLLMSNTHTINESLIPKKPFALMKDFVPIAPINYSDLVLVVHPSVPAKSVAELVKLAKVKAKGLNYASSGNGTPYHLAGELFKSMAKVDIVHIPHKGSGEARTSVISGQVEMMFDAVTTMTSNVRAGRVRALGTTGLKRSKVLPEVPTVSEAGVKGYESPIWLGVMAPAGTPRAILDRLNAEITKVTARPETAAAWEMQGAEALKMSVSEFEKYLNKDIAKWAQVVKVSGAKPD
jgi:tripartite-type tricarboxylate transporter receptor subunit TctC